jgi:hypothetical protein
MPLLRQRGTAVLISEMTSQSPENAQTSAATSSPVSNMPLSPDPRAAFAQISLSATEIGGF